MKNEEHQVRKYENDIVIRKNTSLKKTPLIFSYEGCFLSARRGINGTYSLGQKHPEKKKCTSNIIKWCFCCPLGKCGSVTISIWALQWRTPLTRMP